MIGEETGKKRGGGEENPRIHKESKGYFNIQISKEKFLLLPSLIPWKTDVPKFQCEYSVRK